MQRKSTKNGSGGEPRRYAPQQEQSGGNFPPENSVQFSYNSEQLQTSPQALRSIPEEGRHASSTRHNNRSQQRANSTNQASNSRLHRQQSHSDGVFNRSNSHRSLNRNRSMVRPERYRPKPTMINNPQTHGLYRDNSQSANTGPGTTQNLDKGALGRNLSKSSAKDYLQSKKDRKLGNFSFWSLFARVATFWAPSFIMSACGLKESPVQQAWREKVTLCLIILFFCFLLGVFTFGLRPALCPDSANSDRQSYSIQSPNDNTLSKVFRKDVLVYGVIYRFDYMKYYLGTQKINLTNDFQSVDLSQLFDNTNGHCAVFDQAYGFNQSCQVNDPYGGPPLKAANGKCLSFAQLAYNIPSSGSLAYEWFDFEPNNINSSPELIVFNNNVINMTSYFSLGRPYFPLAVHNAIITALNKDGTLLLNSRPYFNLAMNCIGKRYAAGVLSTQTIGCMATNIIMIVSLAVILIVIMTRFIMAIVFSWFMSRKLTKVTKTKRGLQVQGKSLYTVMMVTCYSEGEAGLRTTLDSLTTTDYSDKHKLFFIIADGLIKGEGNDKFTPDICLSLIDLPSDIPKPESCSYIAIADGEKQLNLAKVYAGHYTQRGHRVPVILVVKVGNRKEKKLPKPGNRGKRDSQMIMMNFFQRVFWNDRFTELDYEIFWKIYYLMGITADKFELVLMVDADTKVAPTSLTYMVSAMKTDPKIMGLCGETRIANKTGSWVSMIQVFEYYVSHHLGKSFESVFGGVTCLPGCFCMYRLKVQKGDVWIPLLCALDVVSEYQQNAVTTLHQKNLLLLGEDRFLSTLMLRSFPKRKMMFVPDAVCHTIVPDSFNVLLSQRRRWINSTIHNLLELSLVSELCGIGCLSMQAMIILDLIGTIVLPIAVCLTFFLIIMTIASDNPQVIPLLLLAAVLGLPGVLIILTTRKIVYVFWMFVYLLALPIWNLVLPVYAYWHFDDFSWGETRKVLGDADGDDHGKREGVFDPTMLVMRRWEDWERERRCMSNRLQFAKSEKHSKTSTTAKSSSKKAGKQTSKHQSRHPTSPESTPASNFSLKPSEQQRSYPYSTSAYNSSQTLLQPPQDSQTRLLSSSSSNETLNNGVNLPPPHDNYNYWPAASHGNSQNTTPSPPPSVMQSPYQTYSYILPHPLQGQSESQNTTLSPPSAALPYEQLSYQNYNYMGVPPQGQHNMTNTAGPDGSRHMPMQFPPSKRDY